MALRRFVIERTLPGAGDLTRGDFRALSQNSCGVIQELGPSIEWMHSYVTGDKIYCVYGAEDEDVIREHARRGGFPVDSVREIVTTISPATAA